MHCMVILDDDSLLVVGGWQMKADIYPIEGEKPDFGHDCIGFSQFDRLQCSLFDYDKAV
jgi:hypothetical protein